MEELNRLDGDPSANLLRHTALNITSTIADIDTAIMHLERAMEQVLTCYQIPNGIKSEKVDLFIKQESELKGLKLQLTELEQKFNQQQTQLVASFDQPNNQWTLGESNPSDRSSHQSFMSSLTWSEGIDLNLADQYGGG